MDRQPGLSVRWKLAISYAGFLMLAGVLLVAVVWLFLLRYVPERAIWIQGEQAPGGLFHQPVDQQRIQRPVPLGGGQNRRQRPGDCTSAGAQRPTVRQLLPVATPIPIGSGRWPPDATLGGRTR